MNHSTTPIRKFGFYKVVHAVISAIVLTGVSNAAVHGITGSASATDPAATFNLTAAAGYISQPDGARIYAWGFGCDGAPTGFLPSQATGSCPQMQLPGPTLIVTEGQVVTVNLKNLLPPGAGATSIVFPGMTRSVPATPTPGILTNEAANGSTGNVVTYTFTAGKPGTYAYYSGTQPDLQIEMGLSGAIIVLPNSASAGLAKCAKTGPFSLAASAYAHPDTCYDREYLFQFSELSSNIHEQVKAQVDACPTAPCAQIAVIMEPYRPNYYMVNGRSMPDDMDVAYAPAFPNQPYNGNPHMHPGENVLMRVVGQGRWQHPFHFHGNHARVLARDANLLVDPVQNKLAGPLLFTIPTVSGQTVDAIFTWTGQGLNWDVYGSQPHTCNTLKPFDANGKNKFFPVGSPQLSGYDGTSPGFDSGTKEYCKDHGKPIPATPPDPSIVVNGQWYAGTPYLGMQTVGNQTPEAPGTLNQNPQGGYAYMWHSHNEREITTNDVFPGGMMMMLLIDPFDFTIDETQ